MTISAEVIHFPSPEAWRRRRASCDGSYGECSIIAGRIERPPNVEVIEDHMPSPLPWSPELGLFMAIYGTMTWGQRSDVRNQLARFMEVRGAPVASLRAAIDFLKQLDRMT